MTTEATPYRLYLMQVASVPPIDMPVVCYLVQMTDGKNILIDSGLPHMTPDMPRPTGYPMPEMGKTVIEQLAQIGLQPSNIDMVIATHFDMDHAGHHEDFAHAEYVVQREHHTHALNNPRFAASRSHWDLPEIHYRFVDGDTELFPGLMLIETSGHTRGHQSVLVRLPQTGSVLLAIDAVRKQGYFNAEIEPTPPDDDAEALRASAKKLIALAEHENAAFVVFGHDGTQWATLKKLPEYYA